MSLTVTNNEKPLCRYCEKELHGRLGKIFCNVDCKNNYNSRIRSKQRAKETRLLPEVIKIIKQNYRIMLRYQLDSLEEGKEIHIKKDELHAMGFDHRYCTGAALGPTENYGNAVLHFAGMNRLIGLHSATIQNSIPASIIE